MFFVRIAAWNSPKIDPVAPGRLNFWFGDGNRGVSVDKLDRLPLPLRRFHLHRFLEMSASKLCPRGTHWGRFLTHWAENGDDAFEEPHHQQLAKRLGDELAPLLGGGGAVARFLRDLTGGGRLLPEKVPIVTAHDQRGVATPEDLVPPSLRIALRGGSDS